MLAMLGRHMRLVLLSDEVVQIVVGFENDMTAVAAVAAAGSSLGSVGLAQESHATAPASAGPSADSDFVDEHEKRKRRGCAPRLDLE